MGEDEVVSTVVEVGYLIMVISSGIFMLLSIVSSFLLIKEHRSNWTNPEQQKLIIIIIIMVPLFSINSFLGLADFNAPEWVLMIIDSIKECYEAYVLHAFIMLMFSLCGITSNQIPDKLKHRHIHQSFPFNYFMKDMELSRESLRRLELWTTQFILIRPILSIISLIMQISGHYDIVYFEVSVILNISVTMAVYALLLFYHTFEQELHPYRPLAKFLCIKGVVFFCFWQGIILEILVFMGIVHQGHLPYTVNEVSYAIQCWLTVFEMGTIFAYSFSYAFSAENYKLKQP